LVRSIITLYISPLKKLKNLIFTEVFFLLHHYSLCSGVRKSRQEFRTCKVRAKLWGGEELFTIGWPEIGLGDHHRHGWQAPGGGAEVAGMHCSFLRRTPCSFALEGVLFFVPFLDQEEINRREIIPPELYGSRVVKTTVKLLDFPSDIGFL